MNFSLEIGPHSDLETLPALKDVYITFLPGGDFNETASKAEINKIELARVRKEFAQWSADSGSSGVQIAALTAKIAYMTEHLKLHKKDKHGRLGLSQMLERRKKLLKYLRRTNATTYETVITKLGLKDRSFVEEPLGAKWPTRGGK